MSASRPPAEPIRSQLAAAESELSRRLREACEAEARGVSTDSTEEIRRLEDTLFAAVTAAQRAQAARRRLDEAAAKAPPAPASAAPPAGGEASHGDAQTESTVREFEDETGRSWRAWPVVPAAGRAHQTSSLSLGEFQQGWICFEALDNSGRRRLPRPATQWTELAPEELPRLLAQAITVPPRKTRQVGTADEPHADDASPETT